MESKVRLFRTLTMILVVLITGIAGGILIDRQVLIAYAQQAASPASAAPDFSMIEQAWRLIDKVYVDRPAIQSKTLTYGAISGMVESLGDTGHSTFLTPQMVKADRDFELGQFEGIGAQVEKKNEQIVIVAPIDDSPAQKAGLRPGDVILKVDGSAVSGLPIDQVITRILGPAGTPVTLDVLTPSTGQSRQLTIVRARITVNGVSWQPLPGTLIADIRIVGFSQDVGRNLKAALLEIKQKGMTGLILDLRNNPGGLLSEAVDTTSQFLSNGNVLLEKDAQGKVSAIPVESGGVATDLPMVVLVNAGTASGAEIVSGALQDARRAPVVGETTFGTGTVLNQFPLSDGSALMLATQEWLTPAGRVIWHQGISPDILVLLPGNVIPVLPSQLREMTWEQLNASGDVQLLRAIDVLSPRPAPKNVI